MVSPSRRTCAPHFYDLKKSTFLSRIEPANLGSRGEHVTPRSLRSTLYYLLSCSMEQQILKDVDKSITAVESLVLTPKTSWMMDYVYLRISECEVSVLLVGPGPDWALRIKQIKYIRYSWKYDEHKIYFSY